jgi:hypothetical protein
MEFWWIPESSEGDYKGENSTASGSLYITRKFLELKCLKWAFMTHLDI